MNNINSSNDLDNENVRNIIINKKDKKGNKKRQINFLTDNNSQSIGINILKDDCDLKNEDIGAKLESELDETCNETGVSEVNTTDYINPEILEISNSTSENIIELVNQQDEDNKECGVVLTETDTVTQQAEQASTHAEAIPIIIPETPQNIINNTHQEVVSNQYCENIKPLPKHPFDTFENFAEYIYCNFENYKQYMNNTYENKLINLNIVEHRLGLHELKAKEFEERICTDITQKCHDYKGLSYIVYAGVNIEKDDIVEIYYENDNIFVRPVSPNNNNFYGIALHTATKDTKVQVLTSGICRVKLFNNIVLPIMKCINGKLVMLRDQKNNVLIQQTNINIISGDLLIPMKNNDDIISGQTSIYSQFNNTNFSCMIPYKNVLFNNITALYTITNCTKTSPGLRFAYVLDPVIKDNTILVRI